MVSSELTPRLEIIPSKTIIKATFLAHEYYKKVMIRQKIANKEPVERLKLFDLSNKHDRYSLNKLLSHRKESIKEKSGKFSVDILKVNFNYLPYKLKLGTVNSVLTAIKIIEARIPGSFVADEKRLLMELNEELLLVIDYLHRKEAGEKINSGEDVSIKNHWAYKGGREINRSWSTDNKEREELADKFDTLSAFEQEKDIIFIAAALKAMIES
jgi:hypothetical protein